MDKRNYGQVDISLDLFEKKVALNGETLNEIVASRQKVEWRDKKYFRSREVKQIICFLSLALPPKTCSVLLHILGFLVAKTRHLIFRSVGRSVFLPRSGAAMIPRLYFRVFVLYM